MDLTRPVSELVVTAQAAETAGVDYLVLPDRTAAAPDGASPPTALIAAAFLAAHTDDIGIVVTAATSYHEPYSLARQIASLDHISAGRVGWFADSTTDPASDANHRREGHDPARNPLVRAREFVPLVRALWDSWEDGAFVHEKDTGRFVDADRIHVVDHVGEALAVRGPLNVIRPPQGQPVVFATADDVLADHADVLFSATPQEGHALMADASGGREEVAARLRHPHVLVRCGSQGELTAFLRDVLPLLRDGIRPAGTTLRARLGLAPAPNRFALTKDEELTSNAR
ncbi:LLM class flavin-dependent oxidoreductase [Lentzea sp. NPDC051208]|uniref:LLM class flavin-dependent oxidoreductase n=1 Tax=Lentzea sp. NPDC051208 TaxID=3154642 RepID=UPI003423B183